jgi:hypothetical protein
MKFSAVVLALTALIHSADGQAAKFAASWATGTLTLVDITSAGGLDGGAGSGELLATIKPPGNGKELLVGVSGVVNIVTTTEVKGTNKGGKGTAEAEATLNVAVKYGAKGSSGICSSGTMAAPGLVTFASRKQTLSLKVDLDIVCTDTQVSGCELTADDLAIDGFVSVGLGLDTTQAHHFNFVIPNVPSGEFDVLACYAGSGSTSLTDGFEGNAAAKLAITSRMVTVQQVKAVNGPVVDNSI